MELYTLEKSSIFNDRKNVQLGYPDEVAVICDKREHESDEEDEDSGKVQCMSLFLPDNTPQFWCSITRVKLAMQQGDPTKYNLPPNCKYLYSSKMEFNFMQLSVKQHLRDSYRISWCRYSCFKTANSSDITIGSGICSMDSIAMVMNHSYNRELAYEKPLDYDAGNDPELITWSSSLPNVVLPTDLGLFYSKSRDNGLPVYKIPTLCHEYAFDKGIMSLLKMQKYEDDEWVSITPDLSVLDGVPSDGELSTPVMYGDFSYNTPLELNTINEDNNYHVISDYIKCDYPTICTFGETVNIPLTTSGYICDAIFVAAVNLEAESHNDHFNFTDSTVDCMKGKSPIAQSGVLYSNDFKKAKVPLTDYNHSRSSNTSGKFSSRPRIPGIWAGAFSYNGSNVGRSQGIIPEDVKAMLVCKLRPARKGEKKIPFRIVVRLKIQRSLTLVKDGHVLGI